MSVVERVDELEERARGIEARLAALEAVETPAAVRTPAPPAPATSKVWVAPASSAAWVAPARPTVPAPVARRRSADVSLEDLLGGRVLAWAGGATLLAGLIFLLVIAVSRGWIGEEARTLLAAMGSLALLAAGVLLYERRGHTDAALAATAAGIAGLYASIVVAALLYDLIPASAGLLLAFVLAATATAVAVRWKAPGIAALGILGAILAPVLVDAGLSADGTVFLFAATASAVGVLVWKRWTWLAFATFGLATPQWVAWLVFEPPGTAAALVTLVAFGMLAAAAAVGFELRTCSARLAVSSHVLLVLNALVLATVGWGVLSEGAGDSAGHLWLGGLAVAHLALALVGERLARVSHELVLSSAVLGVVLADVAFASVLDGLPLVAGWAASAVAMGALAHAAVRREDVSFSLAGLGAQLGLAIAHVLVYEAPLDLVDGVTSRPTAAAALMLVAAGCFISGRLAQGSGIAPNARVVLDGAGLLVVAHLTSVTLDGPALTLALAAEAVALAGLAHRRGDAVARAGAAGFLGLATLHGLAILAPPEALVVGVEDAAAALALLGVAASAFVCARMPGVHRLALHGLAAALVLYLASTEIVTAFQPALGGDLGVRQQGQALLSGLWAFVGVAALVAGLMRDRRELRLAALALLAVTLGKVSLYDLASLDSMYRVASFVALGALLLIGAFAWQRMRPAAPTDVPDAGPGAR